MYKMEIVNSCCKAENFIYDIVKNIAKRVEIEYGKNMHVKIFCTGGAGGSGNN